ncbi:G-box-binding factor-like [Onychostoma macrolepis]|nr:G-box-binding factor-like [Onychostoma macrolepis]
MSCNTLTAGAGAGAITVGTGGAVKEGKRRKTHSINEKHYRLSINNKIQELRNLLNIDPKVPKSGVLQKAIEYIKSSQQVNHNLQQENHNLHQENLNLQQENLNLQQENHNLQQENHNLHQVNHILQQENHNLHQENLNLQQENHNLQQVNHNLKQENHNLHQVNHNLQQENLTLEMANQNNSTFGNLVFDKRLEKILEEFFDEAELFAYGDDGGVNNSEHNGSDSQVITLPAEEALQEDVVGTESRHEPDNVTRPSHGPSLEEGTHTSLATSPQCTGGQGVKRRRLPEEDEVDDSPSTRRLRTSENNKQDYDEEGLTAWSDSLVHASDQVSSSNPESELPHEIPRERFRDHNLNRRLDYNMLSRVNWYFERLFNLAGQPPSYPEAEDIVAGALSMSNISEDVREQRVEQRLVANALLLMGERLNLIQRMLMELYSHMMRRP